MVAKPLDLPGSDAYVQPWAQESPPPPPDPGMPPAAPAVPHVPYGEKYEPAVERWRPGIEAEFAAQGVPTVDARGNDLIDKSLHVLTYESHGDDTAVGDGGLAHGGFQDHYIDPSADMRAQIAEHVRLVKKNINQWTDYGEGVTYEGKPFGSLGRVPYGTPPPGGYGGDIGSAISGVGSFVGGAASDALERRNRALIPTGNAPLIDQLPGRQAGGFRGTEMQPDPNATFDDPFSAAAHAVGSGVTSAYDAGANFMRSHGPAALLGDPTDTNEDPVTSAAAAWGKGEQLTHDQRLQAAQDWAAKHGGGQLGPDGQIRPGGFGSDVARAVVPNNWLDAATLAEPFKEGIADAARGGTRAVIEKTRGAFPEAAPVGSAEYFAGLGGGGNDLKRQIEEQAARDAAARAAGQINIGGMGTAMSENFYQQIFDQLQKGTSMSGQAIPEQFAEASFKRGGIQGPDDVRAAMQSAQKIVDSGAQGPELQKALNDALATPQTAPPAASNDVPSPASSGGGAPPPEPAAGAPPTNGTPGRQPLPELGDSGIKAALAAKKESTLEPGAMFGEQGSIQRKAVGIINPSVDMPPEIHVANQARSAVKAVERTAFGDIEIPAYKKLADAFEAERPRYLGTPDRPNMNDWTDYAEHPSMYQASPSLTAAKDSLREAQNSVIARARSEYGVDVKAFQGIDPDGVYIPHMESRESLEGAVAKTERSLSSRGSMTKERAYDSLNDRMANNPAFKPERDPTVLGDLHSSSLASMAANNTFKAGAGGKSLTEVMDEVHPGLRDARDKLTSRVAAVKSKIDAAEAAALQHDAALAPLLKQQAEVEARAVPRMVDLAEADKLTPDLKKMQIQLGELRVRANSLDKAVARSQGRQAAATLRMGDARAELGRLTPELADLRARYHAASPGDYVMNKATYQYHMPAHSAAIDMVGKTGFDNAAIDGAISAGNKARAVGLGPDFSPLTIQGGLGFFSHPEIGIKNGAELFKAAFSSPEDFKAALDPDLVRRFEFASNRRLGMGSEEMFGDSGKFSLPGQPIKKFNDALERVVDLGTLKAFENDSNLLMKMGETSQNVADHEAANSISKMIPRLNNAETGRSAQRVALEGLLPTSRSFTAQPFSFAMDYGKALIEAAKGEELLGREKLALIRGTTMLGTMATLSVSSALIFAEANGKNPAEAVKEVVDPDSSRFLSLIVGDKGSIPLGGPFRRAFLGLYRTFGAPARHEVTGERARGPVGLAAALSYGHNTLQPMAGASVDVLTNRDWKGDPIRTGNQFHQALDSIQHLAEASNLLAGGTAQGAEQGGIGGALQGAAIQGAGVNFTERQPYDQLDALSVKQGLGHYTDLTPKAKEAFDASPEAAAIIAKKPQTPYQASKAELESKDPAIIESKRAEESFNAGTPIDKPLREKWHDESIARQTGAVALEDQFAKQFAGFSKTKYETALRGYFSPDNEKTDADGNRDYDATEAARQDYFKSLPADQQQWINEALQVSRDKKSDLHKDYLDYIDAKRAAGYFQPGADSKKLDAANPALDVENWKFGSDVKPDKDGKDLTPALNSIVAVNAALGLNLPGNRPVKLQGMSRPVNETPGTLEAFQSKDSKGRTMGQRAADYIAGYANSPAWVAENNADRNPNAIDKFGKDYAHLEPWQQKEIDQALLSANRREVREDDRSADLHAYLAWSGVTNDIADNDADIVELRKLREKYGRESVKPGAKPITYR